MATSPSGNSAKISARPAKLVQWRFGEQLPLHVVDAPTALWREVPGQLGERAASAHEPLPYGFGAGPSTLYFFSVVRSATGRTSTTTLDRPTTSPSESKL